MATEADVARLYSEAMEKLGGIDVAVLNAGVGRHGNLETISIENFDLQFNTNVRGVFLWLKHILPHMKVCNGPQILHLDLVVHEVARVILHHIVSIMCLLRIFLQVIC